MAGSDGVPTIAVSTGFTDYGDYLGLALSRPLVATGAIPLVLPYLEDEEDRERALDRVDGLLLGFGRDLQPRRYGAGPHPALTETSPHRDEFELAIASQALRRGLPILGICRGMQVINVALGGSLHPDHRVLAPPADQHPGGDWERWEQVVQARLGGTPPPAHPSHAIEIEPGSLLASALGARATVNSYHHQSLAELGDGVVVTARAPDGMVEAIEARAPALCMGVQWELQEEPQSPVFDLIVGAAVEAASSRADRCCEVRAPA